MDCNWVQTRCRLVLIEVNTSSNIAARQAAGVGVLAADVVGGVEAGETGGEGMGGAVGEGQAGEIVAEFAQGAQVAVEGDLAEREDCLQAWQ